MDWAIAIQRWLYGGMSDGMRSTAELSGLPALMGAAFLFGMVHALMPGHGKSVLVAYHLGRPGRVSEGLVTGTLLSLTHVGSAVVFVLLGMAVISRTVAAGGRAPAFELASAVLIFLIGVWLVFRALMAYHEGPHTHDHDTPQNGRLLAFVTGLVPCPLTTFILSYAIAHRQLAVGLATVAAMTVGLVITIAGFTVAAILARQRMADVLSRTQTLRYRLGAALEFGSAYAVLIIGAFMLRKQLLGH